MKNLIIFDHPYTAEAWRNIPHQRSFCAALCKNITDKLEARGDEVLIYMPTVSTRSCEQKTLLTGVVVIPSLTR